MISLPIPISDLAIKMNGSKMFDTVKLEDFSNQEMQIFKWEAFKTQFLLALLVTTQVFSLGGKTMIINYVARFAPRERPINTLIMIDQV